MRYCRGCCVWNREQVATESLKLEQETMTSAQEQTVARYHELMQVNAVSHCLRSARELGILDQLGKGQHTLAELSDVLSLCPESAQLFLDVLVAVGIIERYGDDYALSHAAQLLCQYDRDLGDATWSRMGDSISADSSSALDRSGAAKDVSSYFDHQSATQWIHTSAAMQAAEVLDVGGDGARGWRILDLGCGSAVWSCAMGHRDPTARVTVVDHPGAIEAAIRTAESIEISDRFESIDGDLLEVGLPAAEFDLVVLPQRTSGMDDETSEKLIARATSAAKPSGRVAVIDVFRAPSAENAKPTMVESIEALRTHILTEGGRIRTVEDAHELLAKSGLEQIQFAFLSASRFNFGIAVGVKPSD